MDEDCRLLRPPHAPEPLAAARLATATASPEPVYPHGVLRLPLAVAHPAVWTPDGNLQLAVLAFDFGAHRPLPRGILK